MTQDEHNTESQSRLRELVEFAKQNRLPLVTTSLLGTIALMSGELTSLSPIIAGAINLTASGLFEQSIGSMMEKGGDEAMLAREMDKLIKESGINDALKEDNFQIEMGRLMREQRHIRYILKHSNDDLKRELTTQLQQFGMLYQQLYYDIVESLDTIDQKIDLLLERDQQRPQAPQPTIEAGRVTGQIDRRYAVTMRGRDADLKAVTDALAKGLTVILGIGGIGKSRLAAEVVNTHQGEHGVVWHTCTKSSWADEVINLIRHHFSLTRTTSREKLLSGLQQYFVLVVLDNMEEVIEDDTERRGSYQQLINDLLEVGVSVLLTTRLKWDQLNPIHYHELNILESEPAEQMVQDTAEVYQLPDVADYATTLAQSALYHPWLIEFAVELMTFFTPEKVIADLQALQNDEIQRALHEMISHTATQMMLASPSGREAMKVLRRLIVCRGGFTYEAAEAIAGLNNTDELDDALKTLQIYRLVTLDRTQRYAIDALVIATLQADNTAYRPHYDYYKALVNKHDDKQDYLGLRVELANLSVAFEWSYESEQYEDAYWLAKDCYQFLRNHNRSQQNMDWIKRVVKKLVNHTDRSLVANSQVSLGLAYNELSTVEEPEANIERAIKAYEVALRYFTPKVDPLNFARTQNYLGLAYADLASVGYYWKRDLLRAIKAFEEALQYTNLKDTPIEYLKARHYLGYGYHRLSGGLEQELNLRRAIEAYKEVLQYTNPKEKPLSFVRLHNNLGFAYRTLAGNVNQEKNLRLAIQSFEEGLKYISPKVSPLTYVETQKDIGNMYQELAKLDDQAEDLRHAINAFQEALKYSSPMIQDMAYAGTHNNLGTAYWMLASKEAREQNLHHAIDAFQVTLKYASPYVRPDYYTITVNNLGRVYRDLADITDRETNLNLAIETYEKALEFNTGFYGKLAYAVLQNNLGQTHQELGNVEKARTYGLEALQYFEKAKMEAQANEVRNWLKIKRVQSDPILNSGENQPTDSISNREDSQSKRRNLQDWFKRFFKWLFNILSSVMLSS